VTTAAAKAGGTSEKDFVDRQRKMAIESVNLWKFEGHDNPEHLKKRFIAQINAWNGIIIKGARSVSG
jgi:hypothetical protein